MPTPAPGTSWWTPNRKGTLLGILVFVLILCALFIGRWWGAPSYSAKDSEKKMTPVKSAVENFLVGSEQVFQAGLEKSGVEVVSQADLMVFMVDEVKKKAPHCIGPKQDAVLQKHIKKLRAEEAKEAKKKKVAESSEADADGEEDESEDEPPPPPKKARKITVTPPPVRPATPPPAVDPPVPSPTTTKPAGGVPDPPTSATAFAWRS